MAQDYGSFDQILKFAHIARPGVRCDGVQHFQWNVFNSPAHSARKILCKMSNQWRDVFATFPEWGYHDGKNVQTVVEVTAKFVATLHFFQIAICGCNHSNADAVRPTAS